MHSKEHLLDKRVIKRALQEGLLDKAQLQKTLDELPDLSHRVQSSSPSAAQAPKESPAEAEAPAAPAAHDSSSSSY
jgi:hypothetical protein